MASAVHGGRSGRGKARAAGSSAEELRLGTIPPRMRTASGRRQ